MLKSLPLPTVTVSRPQLTAIMSWMLASLTLLTLILQIPDETVMQEYQGLFLIYALLSGLAIYLSARLPEGEISSAHIVGMLAALSQPGGAQTTMLWAVALGALIGGGLLHTRFDQALPPDDRSRLNVVNLITITAQVTLSHFVAVQVYEWVGGTFPLTSLADGMALPLLAFGLTYLIIYFAIFLLRLYTGGQSIRRLFATSTVELITMLTLPVPFALLGAEVYNQLSSASFVILVTGITLTLIGQHAISRAGARLRHQVDELRSLSVVSQVVNTSLNLDALLNLVYTQVAPLLDTPHFFVALGQDDGPLSYPLVMQHGYPVRPQQRIDYNGALVDHVLATGQPLLIRRDVIATAQHLGLQPPAHPPVSWLGVPLIAGRRPIGVMVVVSTQPERVFTANDQHLLTIIAASASIAIENARLYEQESTRADELATLNQILTLLTDTLSPDTVLDTVISSASTLSSANAVAVFLCWDGPQSAISLARSAGLSEHFTRTPPQPLLSLATVEQAADPRPLIVRDVHSDPRTVQLRQRMSAENKRAWVELPLTVGGMAVGVVVLYFNDNPALSDTRIEVLRTFANQAAQAIHNARQFEITDETLERRVGQLLALAAIGHELTATIDRDQICQLVLNHALDVTSAQTGAIILDDPITQASTLVAYQGSQPRPDFYPLLGAGSASASFAPLAATSRRQVVVPIERGGRSMGRIVVERDHPADFSEDDQQFVAQLANQAVIALDNSRLFERIAEARDRLQVILDAMSEAILLVGRDGIIALANPQVNLIGLRSETLLARHLDDLLEQPSLDLAERLGFTSDNDLHKLIRAMRHATTWPSDDRPHSYTLAVDGGQRYIQRQIIPVRDVNEQIIGALLVFYDETETHALEEARDEFSRMIVHDLRGPLTAINTSLKLLTSLIPADSDLRPVMETTAESGRRAVRKLLSRVDSLLDIARMESGHITLVQAETALTSLIDGVLSELNPIADELNVTITTETAPNLPPLLVDADKVERVLLNLLDNALKFSPTDSRVTIRAAVAPGIDDTSPLVQVQVIDQGPGVPDDYKQRLFDRFVEVKGRVGRRRGAGLGLAFCQLIVDAHGGKIWIEDNPQGGSIFVFTVPAAVGQASKPPTPDA